MTRFGFLFVLFVMSSASNAYAYIDPGTGATFVGSMAPLIIGAVSAGFAFMLKIFWHPLKRLFVRGEGTETE